MQYKKKPVVIEAILYQAELGNNRMMNWLALHGANIKDWTFHDGEITIPTLEGKMKASDGDYIIKGIKGEFYPCKPDIFEATYEPVDQPKQEQKCTCNIPPMATVTGFVPDQNCPFHKEKPKQEQVCKWTKYHDGVYQTTCKAGYHTGEQYYGIMQMLSQVQQYKFCPYCGRRIEVNNG